MALAAALLGAFGYAMPASAEPGVAPVEPTLEAAPKPVRELPELRSEDSDTYLLSNGAHALKIYDHPVNFRGTAGSWQPIEDQLVQRSDGTWRPQASPEPISLPASLGTGAVSLGSGARALSFQLQGASGSEGAPAGAEHVYRGALDDTDVTYTATPQAVRETLTLSSAKAPTVFRWRLNLASGLRASLAANGSVLVENAQGATVYTITPPSASDSNPARPFPSRSAVHYELSDGGTVLSLVLDKAWLEDPKRVFPVTIDPEAWFSTTKDCAIISAGFANDDECGSHLYVGPDSPNPEEGVARSLLYFDTSSVPKGSAIIASYLSLHFSWYTTESYEPVTIEAHALTQSFTSGVTWNRYDGTNAWSSAGGDFAKAVAGERVVDDSEEGDAVDFGFTPQVEQWVRDPSSNHGILLKAKDEAKAGYDAFAQSGNSSCEPEPGLEVIYEPRLGIPPMGQVYQQPLANNATMSVNVANGNLNVMSPDVNYATEGYDTELGRSYNSLDELAVGASFGDWRLTKGDDPKIFTYPWDGTSTFYSPDGGDNRFDRAPWADGHPAAGDRAFIGEAGFNEGLVEHEDYSRTLTFPDGSEWKFDNSAWGEATEIKDPGGEGNTISLSYSEDRLSKLKDTHEHSVTVTRNGSHDVTKLVGKLGEEWKYSYTSGRLTKYNAPEGVEAKYGYYEGSGMLKYVTDSSGTWVISYDEQKRVSSIRKVVDGSIESAGSEDEITSFSYETEQTTVTNPLGADAHYYYDEFGNAVEEPATQEAASNFYAGFAGIEAGAAHEAVDLQDHASVIDEELAAQLGSSYTGEWFDPVTGRIKIGITEEGYEQTVLQDLNNLGLADNADIVIATASTARLAEANESLDASLATLLDSGKVRIGLSSQQDAVIVTEAHGLTTAEDEEISEAVTKITAPVVVQESEFGSLLGIVHACDGSGHCGRPLRGGVRITEEPAPGQEEVSNCTAGFIVRSNSDNKPYVLTAGHCVAEAPTAGWSSQAYLEGGDKKIGYVHSFVFGAEHSVPGGTTAKGDAALIGIEASGFWSHPLAPVVAVWGSSETSLNQGYGIIGPHWTPVESEPKAEFVVCGGGVAEGPVEACGVVQERTTVRYPDQTVHNLIVLNMCDDTVTKDPLEAGTSGGPFVKGARAYGIDSGGDGHCQEYYEPIYRAEVALHVRVVRLGEG